MHLDTPALTACLGKSERDPSVRRLLAGLGIKALPPPQRETWQSRFMKEPLTVLNGRASVLVAKQGLRLVFDFPSTRDGFTERLVSYKGPRLLEQIELFRAGKIEGKAVREYASPIVLGWSIGAPLSELRNAAKEKGKAYAVGQRTTPDSIRLGKACFVIHRASGGARALRVEITR